MVYLRRSPRDPELSPFLIHRRHLHAAVHRVQDAILAAPERDWDMAALAAVGFVTERHLLSLPRPRRCLALTLSAVDPAGAGAPVARTRRQRDPRRESARFRSDLQLRRAWSRRWGGSPRDRRARASD